MFQRKNRKGFMLFDAVLAIAILSVAVVGFLKLPLLTHDNDVFNAASVDSSLALQQQQAEANSLSFEALVSKAKTSLGNGLFSEIVVTQDGDTKTATINIYDSHGLVCSSVLKKVKITSGGTVVVPPPATTDSHTKSILHLNGNYQDELHELTWTTVGTPTFESAQYGQGIYLSGNQQLKAVINYPQVTVEAWLRTDDNCGFSFGWDYGSFSLASWDTRILTNVFRDTWPERYWWNDSSGGTASKLQYTYHHVALVADRTQGKFYTFVDGVMYTSGTMSLGVPYPTFSFGVNGNTSSYMESLSGWRLHVDEVKVSDTLRYTNNFTPEKRPFSQDAPVVATTKSLLHFDESIVDETGLPWLFKSGNDGEYLNYVSGKFSKGIGLFGQVSITSNPINLPGDWTAECFMYVRSGSEFSFGLANDNFTLTSTNDPSITPKYLVRYGQGNLAFVDKEDDSLSTVRKLIDRYHHVALTYTRATRMANVYIDGVLSASYTIYQLPTTLPFRAGSLRDTFYYNGAIMYLDEVRISNKLMYTGDFTPPTSPFTVNYASSTTTTPTTATTPGTTLEL